MKQTTRPVDLNLFHFHLPLPGWVSILHRVSGVLLFIGFPFAVWGLALSLTDEASFRRLASVATQPLAKLLLLVLIGSFAMHLLAGLRHLAQDMHIGMRLPAARRSSVFVLVGAGAAILLSAWRLFT